MLCPGWWSLALQPTPECPGHLSLAVTVLLGALGDVPWECSPAPAASPHSSLLLHSLADFLLKNWILICMMNVPLRPQIRYWSLSWFPTHPGGSQAYPYLLLVLHRRVAEFSSTSSVLSFLNLTWKLGNRSCVPASSCESRYLFQLLFEHFCLEESKNRYMS